MAAANAPVAALRAQLMACQSIMSRHRAAMDALRAGTRADSCPMSARAAAKLARQIADLKTATAAP